MESGKLDKRIALQTLTETVNASGFGEIERSWATTFSVWATEMPKKALEKYAIGGRLTEKMIAFKVRFRTDISESMRISFESKSYRILSITNLGRRDGLEILAEYIEGAGFNG
jgi:SPP1 family predicted phage head-tail adaptor